MYYSTRDAARLMTEKGFQIEAATLRHYHKLGLFTGRKTSRGDLVYSADDLVRLVPVIEARRAARLESLRRARVVADQSRRDSQRNPVFA
jgi:DNA-binding transcriptional MerR regulator